MPSVALGALCATLSLSWSVHAKPHAGGDPREVTVVADEAVWAVVESTLIKGLERKVPFQDEETVFWVHGLGLDAMEIIRRRPLLLFLASVDVKGPVAEFVPTLMGKDLVALASRSPFNRLTDPWAEGQVAYVLAGFTPHQLDSLASRVVDETYDGFLSRYRLTVHERLYARGEDRAQTRNLASRYGWSLEVPRPWRMEAKPDEHWVHFVETNPDRRVSVHWEDWAETTVTPEYCLRTRRALARQYDRDDEIDGPRTTHEWTTFLGRPAVEIIGAWMNTKHTSGGPFRTVCFLVPEQQRLYFIDLVTFAPDRPKFYVMTQLGIIAETFKTAQNSTGGIEPS